MNRPETDAEVIEPSLQEGELFSVIFERHFHDIHRFMVAAVGPNDGPDLAGELFLRAFATRHRYRVGYPSARPWLWGIATNLIRDYYRTRAERGRAYKRVKSPLLFEPDPSDDSVNRVAAEAERPTLTAAIQQLRREDAQVLILFAVGGLSYTEISDVLEIAEGTVRSRLNRTRTKLRNRMPAENEFVNDEE